MAAPAVPAASAKQRIGVYYFPGWTDTASWATMMPYPEKKPVTGWYDSGSTAIMRNQLDQMAHAGIDYVAFDWYWVGGQPHADQAVKAYLDAPQRVVSFALLWANDKLTSPDDWQSIVNCWVTMYFKSGRYLKVHGRPVVFVFSYQSLATSAAANKTSVAAYVAQAQSIARHAGLPGLFLVADTDDLSTAIVTDEAPKAGFDAVSAYNLHRPPWRGEHQGWDKLTHGYPALDLAYRANWVEAFRGPLPVVVPMMSGWDHRPWGNSADPQHDRSIATAADFTQHLVAARKAIAAHPASGGLGVICCWNEFGEGSYIEPTAGDGGAALAAVRGVFGPHR